MKSRNTWTLRTVENKKSPHHGCLKPSVVLTLHNSTTSMNSTCTSMWYFVVYICINFNHSCRRQPLKFEKYLKVSNNYFDKRWSGARRIKNVAMVLEWTPSFRLTTPFPPRSLNMPEKMEAALKKAYHSKYLNHNRQFFFFD